MASSASAKKQIVDSIKDKTNILVTVSNNPSVDELSAALGLTIFLNKLGKHATAVVSGQIPSAIDFLDPNKTFEATADSLRDFIIALDKEKADHLRYKLEGDVVKIFITPYRTTISSSDLEFSQGDYNVELVLALNVASRDELDTALRAHGKILHDATVATITAGDIKSNLGSIDWRETQASSVSEMATEVVQELKTPKAAIDEQIATALLTGIVASTERFSNDLTSSKVMTIAAELMAAGANQQLIAAKLEESGDLTSASEEQGSTDEDSGESTRADGSTSLEEGSRAKLSGRKNQSKQKPKPKQPDVHPDGSIGVMKIDHARDENLDNAARQVMQDSQEDAARAAEAELDRIAEAAPPVVEEPVQQPSPPPVPTANITEQLRQETEAAAAPDLPSPASAPISDVAAPAPMETPSIGGTLNATTAQAADEKRREIERDQNRTILSHGKPLGEQSTEYIETPMNAAMAQQADEPPLVDIFSTPPTSSTSLAAAESELAQALNAPIDAGSVQSSQPEIQPEPAPQQSPNYASDQQAALSAVDAAFAAAPVPEQPTALGSEPAPAAPTMAELEANPSLGLPPMPDFNSLPPLPPAPTGVDPNGLPPVPSAPPTPPQDFNPNQFQIPQQ